MTTRPLRRFPARFVRGVRLLALTALLSLPFTAPAFAVGDSGEVQRDSVSGTESVLRMILVTVVAMIVIALLAAVTDLRRRPRYRPGRPWPHDPLWFAGPDDPDAALAGARPLRGTGGASAEW